MSQYEVGTILWIIHRDRPGLVAYRINEEITKKTLEGEKIQYLVQPAIPRGKTVQLESINGRIFLTSDEAKHALIENASRAIDAMIDKTQNLVNKIFFKDVPNQNVKKDIVTTPQPLSQPEKLKQGYQWVTMEDGQKVQVKIPEIMT